MRRLYISEVFRYRDPETGANRLVSRVELLHESRVLGPSTMSQLIAVNQDGTTKENWALVYIDAPNHDPLQGRADIDPLPDFPYDAKVSVMHRATRDAMVAKLTARGIDTAFIAGADGYREVIQTLGRRLEPSFNENNFDPGG